ncbi:MAG: hypothetical protein HY597_00630 [Candidatus Omnitrophica bacterium]|nr:hypothetical protein [Candidatus Omnitrophota bacterium]
MKLSLNANERRWLMATIAVVALALGWTLVGEPLIDHLSAVLETIASKQTKLQKNLKILAHQDQVARLAVSYADYLKSPAGPEPEKAAWIEQIEASAESVGLRVTSARGKPVRTQGSDLLLTVEVEAESTVETLVRFLTKLEQGSALVTVERLRITAGGNASAPVKVSLVLTKVVIG